MAKPKEIPTLQLHDSDASISVSIEGTKLCITLECEDGEAYITLTNAKAKRLREFLKELP